MVKFLYIPESMLKKPDPLIAVRLPVCPASVSWKEARAAVGLSQRFGPPVPETAAPLGLLVTAGRGTPLGVAKLLSCQLVAQRRSEEHTSELQSPMYLVC